MPFELTQDHISEMIETRRDFHAHPEPGLEEVRTAGIVAERLSSLGYAPKTGIAVTGVTAVLEGAQPGPCVMVRADMDALPIHEENDVPYRSRNAGFMHACGHDGHTAIALTVARVLMENREKVCGTVKFVFQPAEETIGGAERMVAEGVLEDPRVDVCLGLHLWNETPLGHVMVADGPCMAATGTFHITIVGKGGHGAAPHLTADPVLAAAHAITAAQSISSRNIHPVDPVVVTFGAIHAGTASNIIPDEVVMKGTIRSFESGVHQKAADRLREIVTGVAGGLGCTVKWDYHDGYPSVSNNPAISDLVRQAAAEVVGAENVRIPKPVMGGEDFAYFLRERPGAFFFIGSANAKKGFHYPHHNPRFDFDEEALSIGARVMLGAVERNFTTKTQRHEEG